MAFTEAEVKKVARLARIRLSEADVAHYAQEMGSILSWIEQLQAVDTDGVEPLSSVVHQPLPWREDKATDGNQQADVLLNAPLAQYGCFAVPKVIE